MKKTKNYIGSIVGKFQILDQKSENWKVYLYCKCTKCGKEKWIAQKHVSTTKCCDSLSSSTQFKSKSNYINQVYNGITILEKTNHKKSGKYLYKCKCHCSNIFEAAAFEIKSGKIKSCGCFKHTKKIFTCQFCGKQFQSYNENTKYCSRECSLQITKSNLKKRQSKDITNQRFGKLVVTKKEHVKNNVSFWLCQCDCGNSTIVSIDHLTGKKTKSCGCLASSFASNNAKNNLKIIEHRKNTFVNGTNLVAIQCILPSNNTSGIKGVFYNKRLKSWMAYLTFQHKTYRKAFYGKEDNIVAKNKAIKYRRYLEEKYFKPVLDEYVNKK